MIVIFRKKDKKKEKGRKRKKKGKHKVYESGTSTDKAGW